MSPSICRLKPAAATCALAAVHFLALLSCPRVFADDRFFPVTSKASIGASSLGTPSTNERGDVVFRYIVGTQRTAGVIRAADLTAPNVTETSSRPPFSAFSTNQNLLAFPTINASGSVLITNTATNGLVQVVFIRKDPAVNYSYTGNQTIANSDAAQAAIPPFPFVFLSPVGGLADSDTAFFYGERPSLRKEIFSSSIEVTTTVLNNLSTQTGIERHASTFDGYSTLDGYVACSTDGAYGAWRGTGPSGLGVYASGGHPGATSVAGFTNTGSRPSVNSLGHLALSATYTPPAGSALDGVYLRHLNGTVRRAGNLNNTGDLLAPVGILPESYTPNSFDRVALNDFGQVLFVALDSLGRRTLFTTALGRCRPILAVGDQLQLAGATHTVASISLFDGLKKNGQGVFWISTSGGQDFVLRAIRGFSQAKLSDSPVTPSYAATKYLLRSIPAEETRLNAPLIAEGRTPPTGRIKAVGCNLVSTANLLTAYGHNVSPAELQAWLLQSWGAPPPGRSREDFVKTITNDFVEGSVELYSRDRQATVTQASVVRFIGMHNPGALNAQTNLQKLVSELRQGYPVKVRVPNGGYPGKTYEEFGHYVLAYGLKDPGKTTPMDASDILIHDPGNGGIYTLGDYGTLLPKQGGTVKYSTAHPNWLEDNGGGRRRLHLYRPLAPSSTIVPTMYLALSTQPGPISSSARSIVGSRAYFLITDSLGRRLGTGPDGTEYSEIPGGSFFVETPYTGLDGEEGENDEAWEGYQARYNLNLTDLPEGSYTVTVTAVDSIEYALEPGSTGPATTASPQSGTLPPGGTLTTQITIGTATGDDTKLVFERIDAVTGKLTLFGKAGTSYQLRTSPDLSGWTNVGAPRPGADAVIEWTVPIVASPGRAFYRVESSAP